MDWQNQLIKIYLTICEFFSQLSPKVFLKISPNANPLFTDEETITIYIFGILNGQKNVKFIFDFGVICKVCHKAKYMHQGRRNKAFV